MLSSRQSCTCIIIFGGSPPAPGSDHITRVCLVLINYSLSLLNINRSVEFPLNFPGHDYINDVSPEVGAWDQKSPTRRDGFPLNMSATFTSLALIMNPLDKSVHSYRSDWDWPRGGKENII